MQVVRVSGTVKKAEEEAIRRARLSIRRAQRQATKTKLPTGAGTSIALATSDDVDDMEDDPGFANGTEDQDEPGDVDDESG